MTSVFIGAFERGRDRRSPSTTRCLLYIVREKRTLTTVDKLLQVDAIDVNSLSLLLITVCRLTSCEQVVKVGKGGWQAEVAVNCGDL